jgi:hypothetical protein
MECAICHEETLGRDPVRWGPEFAHRTCVVAFDVGADVERSACIEAGQALLVNRPDDPPANYFDGGVKACIGEMLKRSNVIAQGREHSERLAGAEGCASNGDTEHGK